MEQLDDEGRIYFPRTRWPHRQKMLLGRMQGHAVQIIWDDISPINSQAQRTTGLPNPKTGSPARTHHQGLLQRRRPRRRFLLRLRHDGGGGGEARPQVDRQRPRQVRHPHHAQAADRRAARTQRPKAKTTAPSKSSTWASTSASTTSASIPTCAKRNSKSSWQKRKPHFST